MRRIRFCNLIVLSVIALAGCTGPAAGPAQSSVTSGLQRGEDIHSWNPIHVAGPNKGTNACPVCTYEALPAVVIFTRQGPNAAALSTRLQNLVVQQRQMKLKGFVIVLDSTPDELKQLAGNLNITQIGLCYPDPQTRDRDLQLYKINPAATNTVMIYKNYKITANFVNLDASDFAQVEVAISTLH
jgi:protocatechuate 3,4-dioxygenase beta subunit